MENREILSELTESYRFLNDIKDNGKLRKDLKEKLKLAQDTIEEIYTQFYDTLDKEDIRVKKFYEEENEETYISRGIDFGYDLYTDNKYDSSITCEDTDYFWYKDLGYVHGYENVKIKIVKEERE